MAARLKRLHTNAIAHLPDALAAFTARACIIKRLGTRCHKGVTMENRIAHTRFTVTMTGALLVFLGAAILSNAGEVTAFVVRLIGCATAAFGVVTLLGHLMRAQSIDLIPFEDVVASGLLIFIGAVVGVFPDMFAKVLFSALGVLVVLSGLGDVARSRTKTADEEDAEKFTLRVGIITIATGIFLTLVPSAAVHALPIFCGVALVLDGLSELYIAMRMEA